MSRAELNEEAVFDIARRIEDEATRKDYVEQACASDPALKARVNELLKLHDDEVSFLESPPEGLSPTVEICQVTEKVWRNHWPLQAARKDRRRGDGRGLRRRAESPFVARSR